MCSLWGRRIVVDIGEKEHASNLVAFSSKRQLYSYKQYCTQYSNITILSNQYCKITISSNQYCNITILRQIFQYYNIASTVAILQYCNEYCNKTPNITILQPRFQYYNISPNITTLHPIFQYCNQMQFSFSQGHGPAWVLQLVMAIGQVSHYCANLESNKKPKAMSLQSSRG